MTKIDQFAQFGQFGSANEAALTQFTHFATLSLANAEKFTALGLGVARESVDQATKHAAALASAKDVHEILALNSAALEPVMKRAYAYSRTVYDAVAETNGEVKAVLDKQVAELNNASVSALEESFKYAPAGSETAVSTVKQFVSAAQNAYSNLAAINQQIADTVEKTVEGNVASVKSAAGKAKAKAKSTKSRR
jgi:phasin family protein